jgi:hypothetical protein
MCKPHWFQVPQAIRQRIWKHYVPGQTAVTLSDEYKDALRDALRAIAARRKPA